MNRILVLFVLLLSASVTAQSPPTPAPVDQTTEVAKLKREVIELRDALMRARAGRADCETTLGPIEVGVRQKEIAESWAELKGYLEKAHPGEDCDPRSGDCVTRPEPPAGKNPSEKKNSAGPKPGGGDGK